MADPRPAKLLKVSVGSLTAVETITSGPYQTYPFRWSTVLSITAQQHSSPTYNTLYDGNHVNVGDWVASSGGGAALRISSISSKNANSVVCVLEDVEQANIAQDPSGGFSGNIPTGNAYLFEVDTAGKPILYPLPDALVGSIPSTFAVQLLSRFVFGGTSSGGGTNSSPSTAPTIAFTAVNGQKGFALPATLTDTGIAVATNRRVIVHSIHVTNIGTASADVTASIVYGSSDISIGNTIPVPANSAVELLKKPKVMQPGNLLRMMASAANTLHAVIAWAETTDTGYFGTGVDLTSTSAFDVYTATANSVLESVLVSNDDGTNNSSVTLTWTNASDVVQGYLTFNLVIPADSTVEILEKPKQIPSGHKLRAQAGDANRIEVSVHGKV